MYIQTRKIFQLWDFSIKFETYSGWVSRRWSGVISALAAEVVTSSRACDLFQGCSSPDPKIVYTIISIRYSPIVTKNTMRQASIVCCKKWKKGLGNSKDDIGVVQKRKHYQAKNSNLVSFFWLSELVWKFKIISFAYVSMCYSTNENWHNNSR